MRLRLCKKLHRIGSLAYSSILLEPGLERSSRELGLYVWSITCIRYISERPDILHMTNININTAFCHCQIHLPQVAMHSICSGSFSSTGACSKASCMFRKPEETFKYSRYMASFGNHSATSSSILSLQSTRPAELRDIIDGSSFVRTDEGPENCCQFSKNIWFFSRNTAKRAERCGIGLRSASETPVFDDKTFGPFTMGLSRAPWSGSNLKRDVEAFRWSVATSRNRNKESAFILAKKLSSSLVPTEFRMSVQNLVKSGKLRLNLIFLLVQACRGSTLGIKTWLSVLMFFVKILSLMRPKAMIPCHK